MSHVKYLRDRVCLNVITPCRIFTEELNMKIQRCSLFGILSLLFLLLGNQAIAFAEEPVLATMELTTSGVIINNTETGIVENAEFGNSLFENNIIDTGENGRCRILLKSGDALHLGKKTRLYIENFDNNWNVHLESGKIIVYGVTGLQGTVRRLVVATRMGEVDLSTGKIAVRVIDNLVETIVFDNQATFIETDGKSRVITAGKSLKILDWFVYENLIPGKTEYRISSRLSPESEMVKKGISSYDSGDIETSARVFSQVQTSFPYNGLSAYYLGLINLARENNDKAIKQWQLYQKIDPEGAKENDIDKNLTLLITAQLKDEVKEALANEQQLSDNPPVPNSVGVTPFTNKGEKRYQAISKGITAMIITDLAKVPGLKVLERQKMQKMLDEIKISQDALVDEDSQIRAGKILKAEKIVIGDYLVE
jgi:hypothetical protein